MKFVGACVTALVICLPVSAAKACAGQITEPPRGRSTPSVLASIEKGAAAGDRLDEEKLATAYVEGDLGLQKDDSQAAVWYRKAADHGSTNAQVDLGALYEDGHGLRQDFALAAYWYRKAAESGDADGQNNLANLYLDGKGVLQDYSSAASWFDKAARQGSANAQLQLGVLYKKGLGVPQNFLEASKWFLRAAEQNDPWAQYELGALYGNGQGVPQNLAEAYFWLNLAASQMPSGETTVASERDTVAARLPSGQITEVQARTAQWAKDHPAPACLKVSANTKKCFATTDARDRWIHEHAQVAHP